MHHLNVQQCRFIAWAGGEAAIYLTHESGEDPNTGKRATSITLTGNHLNTAWDIASGGAVASAAVESNPGATQVCDVGNQFDGNASPNFDKVAASSKIRRWNYTDS